MSAAAAAAAVGVAEGALRCTRLGGRLSLRVVALVVAVVVGAARTEGRVHLLNRRHHLVDVRQDRLVRPSVRRGSHGGHVYGVV